MFRERIMDKPLRACVHSIDRDCLVGPPPQTLSAKRQRWNPSMRKATRPFLVEIRRGDRHVPKTTTKPNNVAASRTPQPSHFPQNVMRHADQTFDGSHSATSIGLGEPQTSTAPSLACHRRRRQPVGFSLVCFLSRRWIKPAITPAAFVQSGESGLPPW